MAVRAAIVELTCATKRSSSSTLLFTSPSFLSSSFSSNSSLFSHIFSFKSGHPVTHNSSSSTPFSTHSSSLQHDSQVDALNFDGKHPPIDVAKRQKLPIAAHSSKFSLNFAEEPDVNEQALPTMAAAAEEHPEIEIHSLPNAKEMEELLSLLKNSIDDSLSSNLDNMNLHLHEELVIEVLETPSIPAEVLLFFFNWSLKNQSFFATSRAVESLVIAVLKDNQPEEMAYHLWDIVKGVIESSRIPITVRTLNTLISTFASLGKPEAALQVFDKFSLLECLPNSETYSAMVQALCCGSFIDQASQICKKMVEMGFLPGCAETGNMISSFCKAGFAEDVRILYLASKEKKTILPRRCVNLLIKSLSLRYQTPQFALEIVQGLAGEARKQALRQFTWVIRGFCGTNDIDSAKALLREMIDGGPSPGNTVFNNVINCLAKRGDVREAEEMIALMEERRLKPDVYTYTVVMSGYASGGEMSEACRVMSIAKKKHKVLTPATYHTLISGFCRLGEFDRAVEMMAEMEEFGVKPNIDEYAKLIQSLCLKAVDWKRAEMLLEEMRRRGLQPSSNSVALVGAVKELVEEEVDGETVTDLCSET